MTEVARLNVTKSQRYRMRGSLTREGKPSIHQPPGEIYASGAYLLAVIDNARQSFSKDPRINPAEIQEEVDRLREESSAAGPIPNELIKALASSDAA